MRKKTITCSGRDGDTKQRPPLSKFDSRERDKENRDLYGDKGCAQTKETLSGTCPNGTTDYASDIGSS